MVHKLRMLRASAERVHRLTIFVSNSQIRARAARGTEFETITGQWVTEDIQRLREATRRHKERVQKVLTNAEMGEI